MDQPVGSVIYTQLCNERGGIECDLTATRLDEQRYLLVTGTAFGQHDLGWVRKQQERLPEGDAVHGRRRHRRRYACLGLWGPRARDDPRAAHRAPTSATTRSRTSRAQRITRRRASRSSRCGSRTSASWAGSCTARPSTAPRCGTCSGRPGAPHGMLAGGYRAIDALRVEKGYRVWSSDITPEDNPYQAGLGFAVKLDKPATFVGRDALRAVKDAGVDRRLRCVRMADPLAVPLGSEPVRVDGEIVGRVTSGGSGFRVGAAIGFAYLPADRAEIGRPVEIEVFGEWIAGRSRRPSRSGIRAASASAPERERLAANSLQPMTTGMLDPQALETLIRNGSIDTVLVVFTDLQGRLIGKRVTGHFYLDHVAVG